MFNVGFYYVDTYFMPRLNMKRKSGQYRKSKHIGKYIFILGWVKFFGHCDSGSVSHLKKLHRKNNNLEIMDMSEVNLAYLVTP